MNLRVLYFARLREALGLAQEDITLPAGIGDIASLMTWLSARGAPWQQEFGAGGRLRAAINQQLAGSESRFKNGDEIAFFPPVSGG